MAMTSGLNFFSNASNLLVQGSTFNVQSYNHAYNALGVLDLLMKEACLSALLDSRERMDPPRCSPGTRIIIIHTVIDWITSEDGNASLLWLYGPAGGGKTAVAQTVAEICRREGKFCAGYFFSRSSSTPGRSDGDRIIPTLLYQLLLVIPQLEPHVQSALRRNPAMFHYSKETQMEELIVIPLARLTEEIAASNQVLELDARLVVIDGLDECGDPAMQTELLQIFANAVSRLPIPLRFLITSRPEYHIRQFFHVTPAVSAYESLDLSKDRSIDADIESFLVQGFGAIRRTHPIASHLPRDWPTKRNISVLVRRSCGHFIYVSTAMKYIASYDHRPDDRLKVVLGLRSDADGGSPFEPLNMLYRHIFSCVKTRHLQLVLTLLGLLYIQGKADRKHGIHGVYAQGIKEKGTSPYAYTQRALFERMLNLRPGDIELMMKPLLSIIEFWTYPLQSNRPSGPSVEMRIRILHASVFDFLLDQSRSREFHLDLSAVHEQIVAYLLEHAHQPEQGSDSEGSLTPTIRRNPHPRLPSVRSSSEITITSIQLEFLIYHLCLSSPHFSNSVYDHVSCIIEEMALASGFENQSNHEMEIFISIVSKFCVHLTRLPVNRLCCNFVETISSALREHISHLYDWQTLQSEPVKYPQELCCQPRLESELRAFKRAFILDDDQQSNPDAIHHLSDVFRDVHLTSQLPTWESLPTEGGLLSAREDRRCHNVPCTM